MPIRNFQRSAPPLNRRGLPSAYQQYETAPAPSLGSQAVTAIKNHFVQGFTQPIKNTMAPLYGGAPPSMEDVTQATASMLPIGRLKTSPFGKEIVASELGEMSVSSLLKRIERAKGGAKDQLVGTVYGVDRAKLLNEMVLRLPDGAYTTGVGGSLERALIDKYGVYAATGITEKELRGLASLYEDRVKPNLTLGLNEVILQNSQPVKEAVSNMQPTARLREAKE